MDEFIETEIKKIDTVSEDYGIVWKDIEYEKTESQIIVEKGISVHLMHLEFIHSNVTFISQLVGIQHKEKLQLVRIMHIKPIEE